MISQIVGDQDSDLSKIMTHTTAQDKLMVHVAIHLLLFLPVSSHDCQHHKTLFMQKASSSARITSSVSRNLNPRVHTYTSVHTRIIDRSRPSEHRTCAVHAWGSDAAVALIAVPVAASIPWAAAYVVDWLVRSLAVMLTHCKPADHTRRFQETAAVCLPSETSQV